MLHDSPHTSTVVGMLIKEDETFTASVTSGANLFAVASIQANNLELEDVSGELPGPHHTPVFVWQIVPAGTGNGTTPFALQKDQLLHLNVTAHVPLNSILPGDFTGTVVLTAKTGAKTVQLTGTYIGVNPNTPIGHKWTAMGGEGKFGHARSNEHPGPDPTSTLQEFDNGVLWAFNVRNAVQTRTDVFFLARAIWDKYLALMQATDAFGTPISKVIGIPIEDTQTTAERGAAQHFSGGAIIVARPSNGVFVVYGAIYACYTRFGNPADSRQKPGLGYPISDEVSAGGGWRASHFDAADIYWSGQTGAHEMHGAIRQLWQSNEWLGFPITDESGTPDGVGRFNRFTNGMIYWTPALGSHEVHGAILQRWSGLGYENSYLGYPISNEQPWNVPLIGAGRVSRFQFGDIAWVQSNGNIIELPAQVQGSQQILTPAGTALGGTATLTLKSNGDFIFQCHMHDSGFPSYDFSVRAIWTTPGGLTLAAAHSGHVEGTDATGLTHAPNRDNDHTENGTNPLIRTHWADIQQGRLWVTKDYSATGIVGFVEDVAKFILDLGAAVVGGAIGVVLGLGAEIGQVFGNLGIGGAFGVIAGVAVLVFGGGIIMAVVAGVAVGAVTNALIKQRQINSAEYSFCNAVFQGSLPPADHLIITNLSGLGGRAFTMPGVDKRIYLNMGDGYNDPLNWFPNNAYQKKGQVLVHELTHAWQIANANFLPGFVCQGIVNQANNQVGQTVYQYGPPTLPWNSFNLEAQGAIVDQWFAGVAVVMAPNRSTQQDPADPYFGYIANNIRKRVE